VCSLVPLPHDVLELDVLVVVDNGPKQRGPAKLMASSKGQVLLVRTYRIPTATMVAREASFTAMVSAKIRHNPRSSKSVPDQLTGALAG
jgi:hypothetical protein